MTYDLDMPAYNPEPQGDEYAAPAAEPLGDCPDCKVGTITMLVGCDTCGLPWDDLVAAHGFVSHAT
jgi:hypothetical protein